jgi:hypothetical protein
VSDSTETTDKNAVGAHKQNDKQGYKQEPSKDSSEPLAQAKQASDIDKVAQDVLRTIDKLAAAAQTNISGVPGKDTKITSVSASTETTDKNAVGPEGLNKDQGHEQKPSTDKSAPLKSVKTAEETLQAGLASYDFGHQYCAALLQKTAAQYQEKQAEQELLKEAGRRDFDTLIAQASEELAATQQHDASLQKQAADEEYAGAAAFDELYKQAQYEQVVEQNNQLMAKLAEYAQFVNTKQAEELDSLNRAAEVAHIEKTAALVVERLKNELLKPAAEPTK